jgi:hypothetical protein
MIGKHPHSKVRNKVMTGSKEKRKKGKPKIAKGSWLAHKLKKK